MDWIAATVESIRSSHFEEVTLRMPEDLATCTRVEARVPDEVHAQWLALDTALLRYLTVRSFKLKVAQSLGGNTGTFVTCMEYLLPSLAGGNLFNFWIHKPSTSHLGGCSFSLVVFR